MTQNHVIGSVTLQVRTARQADGFAMQQDMSRWFWDEFLPVLDTVLTELAPDDEIIRLDKLDIAVPALPTDRWRNEITTALAAALRERLERLARYPSQVEAESIERLPVAQSHFEAWLFFLQNGYLPSRYASAQEAERLDAVLKNVATNSWALATLLRLLQRQTSSIQRLVFQHDTTFLTRLAEAITGKTMSGLPARQAALFAILTDSPLAKFVKTVRQQTDKQAISPGASIFSARQFEVWFWQEIFASLVVAPQNFERQIFEERFFKRAFAGKFHISFDQILKSVASLSSAPRKSTRLSLRRLENILRKAAKGDVIETFLQREISSMMKAPELSVSDGSLLASPAPPEEPATKKTSPEKHDQEFVKQEIQKEDSAFPIAPQPGEPPATDDEPGIPTAIKREDALPKDGRTQTEEVNDPPFVKSEMPAAAESREIIETSVGPEPKVLYVQNAGLVLLHPFLSPLFEATGITQSGAFADETARARGVQLLHYLAVGEAEAPEYNLAVPKLLCGMAFDKALDRQNLLDDATRLEGDTMLQAVVKHWGALGAVSNDSLRQGFLQRDGKLSRRDDGWLLQVESKTLDILLGRLPWGLGIVKLKWMPDILHVEWY